MSHHKKGHNWEDKNDKNRGENISRKHFDILSSEIQLMLISRKKFHAKMLMEYGA